MTKTPSALKWLAEKRARLAADALQAHRIVLEFTERHQKLEAQLSALDETIRVYDAALTPSNIEPVAHWKGRHGKRGELQQAFLDILTQHSPDWVSANSIELFVVSRFGLSFASSEERATWRANCLGNGLRGLARKGLVERQDDPGQRTGKCGYWRLKQAPSQSLADL